MSLAGSQFCSAACFVGRAFATVGLDSLCVTGKTTTRYYTRLLFEGDKYNTTSQVKQLMLPSRSPHTSHSITACSVNTGESAVILPAVRVPCFARV